MKYEGMLGALERADHLLVSAPRVSVLRVAVRELLVGPVDDPLAFGRPHGASLGVLVLAAAVVTVVLVARHDVDARATAGDLWDEDRDLVRGVDGGPEAVLDCLRDGGAP